MNITDTGSQNLYRPEGDTGALNKLSNMNMSSDVLMVTLMTTVMTTMLGQITPIVIAVIDFIVTSIKNIIVRIYHYIKDLVCVEIYIAPNFQTFNVITYVINLPKDTLAKYNITLINESNNKLKGTYIYTNPAKEHKFNKLHKPQHITLIHNNTNYYITYQNYTSKEILQYLPFDTKLSILNSLLDKSSENS